MLEATTNNKYKAVREKNRQLNQWEQYYRVVKLESLPIAIQFPTGTRCNLRCSFCTDRQGEKALTDYRDLSFREYQIDIENTGLKEAFQNAMKVALYGWGEPLFNHDYKSIFDYTTENYPSLGIGISTNGVMFTEEWAQRLMAVQNSDVNFSVNAASRATFKKVAGADQFEKVIDNIRTLTSLRQKGGNSHPYVSLSFVATTENIQELADFINLAADLKADSVLAQDIMVLTEETAQLSLMNQPETARRMFRLAKEQAVKRNIIFTTFATYQVDYVPESSGQDFPNLPAYTEAAKGIPSPYFSLTDCLDPWERMMISDDGEVYPCCRFQSLPEESLGNIFRESLQEVWNGAGYRRLRSTVNTANPPAVCAICARKAGLD